MFNTTKLLTTTALCVTCAWGQNTISGDLNSLITPKPSFSFSMTDSAPSSTSGKSSSSKIRVLVQYKTTPTSAEKTGVTTDLPSVNGGIYELTSAEIQSLAANSRVKYMTPDRPVYQHMDYANPTVNASLTYANGFKGANVGVAVIDSGIAAHNDLKDESCNNSRVVYAENFVADTSGAYGHGTHIAGIIGGKGDVFGIKPNQNFPWHRAGRQIHQPARPR